MEIRDNAFLITGGASGLGATTARLLAENGGKVVLRRPESGRRRGAPPANSAAFPRQIDVSREDDATQEPSKTATKPGIAPRGLINCAGVAPPRRPVGGRPASARRLARTISINLIGTFSTIRLAATAMSKNEPNATAERRDHQHGVGRGLRRPDRTRRPTRRPKERRGRHDALPIARPVAHALIRVMTIAPSASSKRAMPARHAAGSPPAGRARRDGAALAAPRQTDRIRDARLAEFSTISA